MRWDEALAEIVSLSLEASDLEAFKGRGHERKSRARPCGPLQLSHLIRLNGTVSRDSHLSSLTV